MQAQGWYHGAKSADMASLSHGPRRSEETLIALLLLTVGMTACVTAAANDCVVRTGETGACMLSRPLATLECPWPDVVYKHSFQFFHVLARLPCMISG